MFAALSSRRKAACLAAGIGVMIYGAVAIASALDRASDEHPRLTRLVPAPFASQALRNAGRMALQSGASDKATAIAEAAVADAPLDPESTALLGAARYATGNRSGADSAFRSAARLGWRIPYTQHYLLGRSLEVGDFRLAALRLDALARQNPAILADRRLLDPFERSGQGRSALTERLAARPPWLHAYATTVADLPADRVAARTAVLRELAGRAAPIGCAAAGPLLSRLVNDGHVRDAGELWRASCPTAAHSLIYDGTFASAALDQTESQFAWFFVGQSDASVVLEPTSPPPSHALVIDNSAPQAKLVARQLVLLDPGSYRLSWRAEAKGGTEAARILAAFSCSPDPRDWLTPAFDRAAGRWTVTLRMDGACPARWLGLVITPGNGSVRLSDVRLEPIAR